MSKKYIMALDQGTTSSRCIIFDRAGRPVSSAQREFAQIFPRAGWVEHDPMEIWSSQLSSATEALARAGISASEVYSIGVTNQRETTLVWHRDTGAPLMNAIVWQCRRTSDMVDALGAPLIDRIRRVTGLVPDAYFSATKIRWILDNVDGARALANSGKLCFGTVDTWLMWQLTGGAVHATDYTNASRTMLFDIEKLCWDDELLAAFDVPRSMLPDVFPSAHPFGVTSSDLFGAAIPISAAAGDQHAALFGQCCFERGAVKNTYGTGCFMLMNTGAVPARSNHGLLTTIAFAEGDGAQGAAVEYALEGSVFSAGSAVQWLRDELKIIDSAADSEALALSVPDTAGAYFVPAFTGLGAPYWNQHARGALVGLTRGCGRAHIARAVLESIAYQTRDVLDAMERDAGTINPDRITIRADGGASQNDFLMQFQSDLLGRKVLRPAVAETTALGAAYLAGLSSGFWHSRDEVCSFWTLEREFTPSMPDDRREALLDGWHAAVRRVL